MTLTFTECTDYVIVIKVSDKNLRNYEILQRSFIWCLPLLLISYNCRSLCQPNNIVVCLCSYLFPILVLLLIVGYAERPARDATKSLLVPLTFCIPSSNPQSRPATISGMLFYKTHKTLHAYSCKGQLEAFITLHKWKRRDIS